MCNLIQNSSFEAGLSGWVTNNVSLNGLKPYEGTHTAQMDIGLASMYQDVPIVSLPAGSSFLLSFATMRLIGGTNLTVTVEYRDNVGPLGTGHIFFRM